MEGKRIKILIVYNSTSSALVDGISAAFQSRGIETLAVREDAVERTVKEQKGKIQALYITPGLSSSFDKLCSEHQVLSITGVPTLTRLGKASIALGVKSGKPSIIVHLQQLKGEGQEFSASFLQIAQIVQ
ncbi:MAG: YfiR/HmsC family protein [Candidatus Kapabacteria bacterium]|nr:YfiR/HmsC family protein [Candidatus Kapabacteria bacterium]